MIDIGVASPSAQGQAMIRTDTATSSAYESCGGGPTSAQATAARMATSTTAGTNHAETRSASRCTGARERWAWATRCTICESSVSPPTRSARMTRLPLPFVVPADSGTPAPLRTGSGSPVSIDSST
jgi:hypothetical protein